MLQIKKEARLSFLFSIYKTLNRGNGQSLNNTLSEHCVSKLLEASDICASYIIAFYAVFAGSIIGSMEDVNHDSLKLGVYLF